MHPSGNSFEPNFRGANPALSSMAAMGRQLFGFDGSQAGSQTKKRPTFLA